MCTGCFTGVEAAVVNAAAGAVAARSGLTRLRHHLAGRGSLDRRRAAHEANADFLTSIGLDPDRVLGPPPTADASD
jgi:hypothetical protein